MPPFLAPNRKHLGAAACPPAAPLLAGARRGFVLALVLGPLLVGCANNPIARQLAASFDNPAPTPAIPPAAGSPTGGTSPAANGQAGAPALVPPSGNAATTNPSPVSPANPNQKGTSTAGPGAKPDAPAKPRAATPAPAAAPYRVTLKLPGADPSAPAEVVTRALRAAGVPFEVETIERIGAGSDASTSSRPAALRATPAPAVR